MVPDFSSRIRNQKEHNCPSPFFPFDHIALVHVPMMRWTAPPDRREITLLLFALTVFTVSYNLDTSIRLLGFDPAATEGAVLSRFGLGGTKLIEKDGRKPAGRRDALEKEIFGDWGWDEGHVAGDGRERSQAKGTGRHGAVWASTSDTNKVGVNEQVSPTVNDGLKWWNEDLPETVLMKHVPGTTKVYCSNYY